MSSSSEGLSDLLRRVVSEYPEDQIGEPLTSHVTRKDLKTRIPEHIKEILRDENVEVKSSPGRGRWTAIPWVAIMDPRETTEIQDGIYVVYLFEPQEDRVTLTLNQGVTTLKNELGISAARDQLEETAREVRKSIQPEGFSTRSLEFPHASQRNKLYGPGTIFYKRYHLGEIPDDEELSTDLRTLVEGYQEYISGESNPKSTPTVYQVPVKTGDGQIRANFDRTVTEGVPREQLEDDVEHIIELPGEHENLRVWGNQEEEPTEEGDYLLFADKDGRHNGDYTVLARVAHSTVLDPVSATQFTEAVGWGDVTDRTFPHVIFLEPIYEAQLNRDWFWDLLGFKGWPNETYSAIDFDRNDSTFFSEYDSVKEFLEDIKGEQIYPGNTQSLESANEYETLDEAIEDIGLRLNRGPEDPTWLKSRLGEEIIEDWSRALQGFRPSDEVSPGTAAKFDQLRSVYKSLKPELEEKADELGIGEHRSFPPAKMLFLGWFRLYQRYLGDPGAPLSQPRLNSILRDTYTGKSSTGKESTTVEELSAVDSPIAERTLDDESTVYKSTAPPDYWLTTYEYAALGLEETNRDNWQNISPGDVILFHSTRSPGWNALDEQESGLLGAGIVRTKTTKPDDEIWWFDEQEGRPKEDSFPYLVAFERLYATGDLDAIDFSNGILGKPSETINADLELLTDNALTFEEVDEISRDVSDSGFQPYGAIKPLDDHDQAVAIVTELLDVLQEVSPVATDKPFEGELDPGEILDGLYFPDNRGEEIIAQIGGALRAGKHTILTGPPGTGKTEIARRVGEYLAEKYPYFYSGAQVTTATADWSTFDTVGGYMPNEDTTDSDQLEFTPGLVLNRFKARSSNVQRNESLVIDELNRADIDKAFGQLFTVLSGQSVQLPYTKDGREVEIAPVDQRGSFGPHEYRIPNSWSLFATLNTYDKTSLYEMSYAFMRRFSFIQVPAPNLDGFNDSDLKSLLEVYVEVWNIDVQNIDIPNDADATLDVAQVWQAANGAIDDRAIGPAVVKDILEYLTETQGISWGHRLTQAVISYILPQLEGVPKRDRVVRSLANVNRIDERLLDQASRDMLQVSALQETDE